MHCRTSGAPLLISALIKPSATTLALTISTFSLWAQGIGHIPSCRAEVTLLYAPAKVTKCHSSAAQLRFMSDIHLIYGEAFACLRCQVTLHIGEQQDTLPSEIVLLLTALYCRHFKRVCKLLAPLRIASSVQVR